MRVALDTNILAYAEGVNGADRKQAALSILQKLDPAEVVIPVQALGELFHVLVRKAGRTASRARVAVLTWQDASQLAETSSAVLGAAMNLATSHEPGNQPSLHDLGFSNHLGCGPSWVPDPAVRRSTRRICLGWYDCLQSL
jgi:predicted nucleic acid-binding protein